MTNKYEVQTKFTYGWENVWSNDDNKLTYFKSREEAQAELKSNVDDWNSGPSTEHNYTYDEYRVVEVK